MERTMLNGLAMSEADMIHRIIDGKFIVEFGIIKEIKAQGIVTVEMAVTTKADSIVITDCVLASFASSSFTVNLKPNVDDKVLVLFPRTFCNKMFNTDKNEPIVTECATGYSIMGGIAVLMNQYQESKHKNYIDVSDGCITMKTNNVEITTDDKDNITIDNGKATVNIDNNGNVKIEAQGKYTIKNNSTGLKEVVDGLAQELENLITVGSPATQSTSPQSKTTIATWRQSKLNQLFE